MSVYVLLKTIVKILIRRYTVPTMNELHNLNNVEQKKQMEEYILCDSIPVKPKNNQHESLVLYVPI